MDAGGVATEGFVKGTQRARHVRQFLSTLRSLRTTAEKQWILEDSDLDYSLVGTFPSQDLLVLLEDVHDTE